MNQPMIVWYVITGGLLSLLVTRTIIQHYTSRHRGNRKPRRIFEIGDEREMFYIPGDIADDDFE